MFKLKMFNYWTRTRFEDEVYINHVGTIIFYTCSVHCLNTQAAYEECVSTKLIWRTILYLIGNEYWFHFRWTKVNIDESSSKQPDNT